MKTFLSAILSQHVGKHLKTILVNVVQEMKYQLETPFKCDNVTAPIKRQIVKNWYFVSRGKFNKCQFVALFLGFSD